jgi:hypothetical protein
VRLMIRLRPEKAQTFAAQYPASYYGREYGSW